MKNRKTNIAEHGVDAKSSPLPASRLTPDEQRFALARELFTKAAHEACVHSDAAPFLLGALHELEQLPGALAAAIDQGELDLEPDGILREQIHRYSPVDAVAEKVHRLAWLLTDAAVFELPHPALANVAALAEDVAGSNDTLLRLARMLDAFADVSQGPGGQDHYAGVWADDYLGMYRSRVDVAEGLAERMAQLADELRAGASDDLDAKPLRCAS
jgi:hypothetical protein